MSRDPLEPYRRLVELAETECALAQAGRMEEFRAVQAEWATLVAALPARGPAEAAPLLRRAQALIAQVEHQLRVLGEDIQRELGDVGRRRAVGRAYAPAGFYGSAQAVDTAA